MTAWLAIAEGAYKLLSNRFVQLALWSLLCWCVGRYQGCAVAWHERWQHQEPRREADPPPPRRRLLREGEAGEATDPLPLEDEQPLKQEAIEETEPTTRQVWERAAGGGA